MTQAAEFQPATDDEQAQAARAVYETRRLNEGDALIESLTDRERLFIESAWQAGAESARSVLASKLLNPHAATLDAKAVARAVNEWRDDPVIYQPPGWMRYGQHYDQRIVGLVRSTTKQLERAAAATSET